MLPSYSGSQRLFEEDFESSRGSGKYSLEGLGLTYLSEGAFSLKEESRMDGKSESSFVLNVRNLNKNSQPLEYKPNGESVEHLNIAREPQKFSLRTNTNADVRSHVQAVMENHSTLSRPKIVRFIAMVYVIALITVIILSVAGQLVVHFQVNTSLRDAKVVNFSGRQRMLSQMLSKDSLAIVSGIEKGSDISYYVNEISIQVIDFSSSHLALISGNKTLGLSGTKDRKVLKEFDTIKDNFEAIWVNSLNILSNASSVTSTNDTGFKNIVESKDAILANEEKYWKTMNRITDLFQKSAEDHLDRVNLISWILHAFVILTLLVEGLFIIRPILMKMQSLINERFTLLRRSLEAEAESSGVSVLMMGYLSHELQNPMEHLKSLLQDTILRLRPYAFNTDARVHLSTDILQSTIRSTFDLIERAQSTSDLMNTVAADIESLAYLGFGKMTLTLEYADVTAIIRQSTRSLSSFVEAGVNLQVDVHPLLVREKFQLDKHRLQQVLTNLVMHALKITKAGLVAVRSGPARKQGWLRFEVQDSGPGLTAEQKALVYEPSLTQNSESASGDKSGLTLYIVKMLTGLQGGIIGVDSEVGKGSTFWFEIPSASTMPNLDSSETNGSGGYSKSTIMQSMYTSVPPSIDDSESTEEGWHRNSWDQFGQPMISPNPK